MKQCLLALFAMTVLQGMVSDCMAQTTSRTVTRTYVEEVCHEGTDHLMETRIWDSYNDYLIGSELKTGDGWICGWGEATGDLYNSASAGRNLKRMARAAAYDQIAGMLESDVQSYWEDQFVDGTHNGRKIQDIISASGLKTQIKARLPHVSKACSYKVNRKNGAVTVVVGVGIDMESYEAMRDGYCTKKENDTLLKRMHDSFK